MVFTASRLPLHNTVRHAKQQMEEGVVQMGDRFKSHPGRPVGLNGGHLWNITSMADFHGYGV
jgi:hypothetical protein